MITNQPVKEDITMGMVMDMGTLLVGKAIGEDSGIRR